MLPPSEERSEFYHNFTHSHIFSYFINIFDQNCVVSVPSSQYIRKNVLPKLFITIDTKKDNVIDFEEYVCAVALFQIGSTEEKIRSTSSSVYSIYLYASCCINKENLCVRNLFVRKFKFIPTFYFLISFFTTVLFLMYEPIKGTYLAR